MEQKENITFFRRRLKALGLRDKPFAQSLYIDLSENINDPPVPIHLGYHCGINALSSIVEYLGLGGSHYDRHVRRDRHGAE